MLADNFILDLDKVKLDKKDLLPAYSGIYYVVDEQKVIWYVGRSVDLRNRWNNEKPHHRYDQLRSISAASKLTFFIYYLEVSKSKLNKQEKKQIAKYQPRLNFTPVVKSGYVRSNYQSLAQENCTPNAYLKIISDNTAKINIGKSKIDNMEQKHKKLEETEVKTFKRKFIKLKDEEINLNLEIEFCIDSKDRFFVRHYIYDFIQFGRINVIDKEKQDHIDICLSNLKSKCHNLYRYSTKWLGYELSCEDVVLIDEEEQFEIESLEIMMPFRMFVDLVEYEWIRETNLPNILEEEDSESFKNYSLSTKIAKWLHNNRLTLLELAEQIK